jgi:hypothetical protein
MEWGSQINWLEWEGLYMLMLDFTTGICKLQLNLRFKHQCRESIFSERIID